MADNSSTFTFADFNRDSWDEVEFYWDKKPFLKTRLHDLFRRSADDDTLCIALLDAAAALGAAEAPQILLYHPISGRRGEILASLSKPVKDPNYIEITGTFHTKMFTGDIDDLSTSTKLMASYLNSIHERALDYYVLINRCGVSRNDYCTYAIVAKVTNTKSGLAETFDIDVTLPNKHPRPEDNYDGR